MPEERPEVFVAVDGERFDAFQSMTMTELYDGVATLELEAPWDPERAEALQAFAPLAMVDVGAHFNGSQMYAGVSLDPGIREDGDERSITHTSYSLPGVLQDCTMPPESFPLEWSKAPLRTIGNDVCKAFGLEFDASLDLADVKFPRAAIKPEDIVWDFLVELAKQRDALVASTRLGGVAIFTPFPREASRASIADGVNLAKVEPTFQSRSYFSDITCTSATRLGRDGGKTTARNTLLKNRRRPLIRRADKSEKGDLKGASEAAVGRMVAEAAGWRVTVPRWLDDFGELWEPGRFVTVKAPGAYIVREHDFLIRGVTWYIDDESWSAALDIVLPESFTNVLPERVPWVS